ncbi:P-loop containing nucleoside triphosphate hydrolase protein [Sistotremastrum suecicum HHB10207 ss-3]|uniref:p-loop containing nucleoside triphosphate hydrolase protein n=1 Tax=Sistotremastrum suecicum HHB10207 ss-3 TaxID=1314776 RepID=A0A166CGH8_9AGAM|nr:P-loop containing nucleoside triphosphate hydrolase protein [Sistotremastrum suecicum HHB10207 ss-3]
MLGRHNSSYLLGGKIRRHLSQFSLRPYQEECLQSCIDALKSGKSRIGVSLPTGSGKTPVFISLLSRLPKRRTHGSRALVIVNSIELAKQASVHAKKLLPNLSVEIEQGDKHRASGLADITVATYQTLLRGNRISKFDPAFMKAIVLDEAHHAAAPSYRRILAYFDPSLEQMTVEESNSSPRENHKIPIIGFSATFSRHDGLALGSVFEEIVYHMNLLDMIKSEWLCNIRFTTVRANLDLKSVTLNSKTGDFNPTSLAQVVNTPAVNNLVVQTWLDRAAKRRSTLVFCANLTHVASLTREFRDAGVDARYLHSGTSSVERLALLNDFRSGQFPVLVNCAILTEGADVPNIDCIIVARPTKSRNVFTQMIGRGTRLSPNTGKTDCRIIDFVDSTDKASDIVSTPTLFGLSPDLIINDETTDDLLAHKLVDQPSQAVSHAPKAEVPDPDYVSYIDYDDPFLLINEKLQSPHITTLSPFAWVDCGDHHYVLECLGKGFLKIEPFVETEGQDQDDHLSATYIAYFTGINQAKNYASPYRTKYKILTAASLSDAVRGCDTYVRNKIGPGDLFQMFLRTARWRQRPATEAQKNFLEKRFSRPGQPSRSVIDRKLEGLTSGNCADMITRLMHGALGRYKKKAKAINKGAELARRRLAKQERETVRVGPLQQA